MRLGVISDLHLPPEPGVEARWHNRLEFAGVAERTAAALRRFEEAEVDAVLVLGDLTHAGDAASTAAALELLGATPRRVLVVAGNHDCAQHDDLLAGSYRPPNVEILTPAGTVVGGIDIVGATIAGATDPAGLRLIGRPLAPSLPPASPAVVASHYPVLSRRQAFRDRGLAYPGDVAGREGLAQALRERGAPAVVLNGHLHARDAHIDGGILQLSAGAIVEAPYEAAIVDVTCHSDRSVTVARTAHALAGPPAPTEPSLSAAAACWAFDGRRWQADPPMTIRDERRRATAAAA